MINNGITFIRVVKTPMVDFLDFSRQLEGRTSFKDVLSAIRGDYYFKSELDSKLSEHVIENALNILKAEFSSVDPQNVIPMWDDQTPDEFEVEEKYGTPRGVDDPIAHALELVDADKKYEVCPKILSLPVLLENLQTARKVGHFEGINSDQILEAISALHKQQYLLQHGITNYSHYEAPSSMILTGEQIRRSYIESRPDTLLNMLFAKTPQTYMRFASLSHRALG